MPVQAVAADRARDWHGDSVFGGGGGDRVAIRNPDAGPELGGVFKRVALHRHGPGEPHLAALAEQGDLQNRRGGFGGPDNAGQNPPLNV